MEAQSESEGQRPDNDKPGRRSFAELLGNETDHNHQPEQDLVRRVARFNLHLAPEAQVKSRHKYARAHRKCVPSGHKAVRLKGKDIDLKQDNQRFGGAANETLTHEEVSAILKRYGEQQAGEGQPRVSDVAEALQVEPSVVSQMLNDIRRSSTEQQLRDRLEQLEREHEELSRRSQASQADFEGLFASGNWARSRYRNRKRASVGAVAVAAILASVFASGHRSMPSSSGVWIFVAIALIVLALRRFR